MIDWDKPIECDLVRSLIVGGSDASGNVRVRFEDDDGGDVTWWVNSKGESSSPLPASFTVRNKKTNKQKAIAAVTVIVEKNTFHAYQGAHSRAQQIIEALIKENLLRDDTK